MKIGYARVSTLGQSLETQLDALKAAGCEEVFKEKMSGKDANNRDQLKAAIRFCRKGDVLVVTKLDRLARSVLDLSQIAKALEDKEAGLVVLDTNIDTTDMYGKLVFNILGTIGEFERSLITARTAEGRERAKRQDQENGVKSRFGRKPVLTDAQRKALVNEAATWSGSKEALAKKYNISRAHLYRVLDEVKATAA